MAIRSSWPIRIVGCVGLLALMGCSVASEPPLAPLPPMPQVTELELVHAVDFETDDIELGTAEAAALRRFAQRLDERLTIVQIVIGHADAGADDMLARRRTDTVAEILKHEGIPAERIESRALGRLPAAAADDDDASAWVLGRRVEVLARGIVIVEPACPDWSRAGLAHGANLPTSNFGCATSLNFVRMLADPRDLQAGALLGPADGAREAAAVGRYRTDSIKPLQLESAGP